MYLPLLFFIFVILLKQSMQLGEITRLLAALGTFLSAKASFLGSTFLPSIEKKCRLTEQSAAGCIVLQKMSIVPLHLAPRKA